MIQDGTRYTNATKECDLPSLKFRMVGLAHRSDQYNFVVSYFNSPLTVEIRGAYNYIKHRGTFYIDGLGMNDDRVPFALDGSILHMVNREKIDLEQWKEKLIEFDVSFYNYFGTIINAIMPPNFTETSCDLSDIVNTMFRLKEWEKK